jgi:hypothetical protein
MGPELD